MADIKIKAGQLGATIRAAERKFSKATMRGVRSAAMRGKRLLAKKSPVGADAHLRASWEVNASLDGKGFVLENTAPYAGIVERGARPHGVSPEGIEAIAHWAIRKHGLDAVEAYNVAWGVAHRLREEGQPGTYFLRDSMEELRDILDEEIRRSTAKALEGGD